MSEREPRAETRDDETGEESFLERWSRRKQAVQHQDASEPRAEEGTLASDAAAEAEPGADANTAVQSASGSEPEEEPEPPGDEDMPPLETIDQGGSVAAFFSPRVSAALRRAALRRLFAQPEMNALEALDDYAEDYSKFVPLGNTVTADMRYRAEQAAKKLASKLKDSLLDSDERSAGADAGESVESVKSADQETAPSADRPEPEDAASSDQPGAETLDTTTRDEDNEQRSA